MSSAFLDFVGDILLDIQRRFPPNQLEEIMAMLGQLSRNGAFLNTPPIVVQGSLAPIDTYAALEQVAAGLMNIPSPQFFAEPWHITAKPFHNSARPNTAFLRANATYRWGPASVVAQGGARWVVAQLFLEALAEANNQTVQLTLSFRDQAGWLFEQSINQADKTINAIFGSLNDYGSILGGPTVVSLPPRGAEAVAELINMRNRYVD